MRLGYWWGFGRSRFVYREGENKVSAQFLFQDTKISVSDLGMDGVRQTWPSSMHSVPLPLSFLRVCLPCFRSSTRCTVQALTHADQKSQYAIPFGGPVEATVIMGGAQARGARCGVPRASERANATAIYTRPIPM